MRRGLTIVELTMAIAITTLCVAALAVMSRAVQISAEYSQGYGTSAQHARVAISRVGRAVNEAYGSQTWYGVWAIDATGVVGEYPDTLVVWRPTNGTPANTLGPPLGRELVIFCPDPTSANKMLEITVPTDNTSMPSPASTATFSTYITGLKNSSAAQKVTLTDLVRVVSGHGIMRFTVSLDPSATDWSAYVAGTTSWANLPWPQTLVGPNGAMRQVRLRTELQMIPYGQWSITNLAGQQSVPFFGAESFCYVMTP